MHMTSGYAAANAVGSYNSASNNILIDGRMGWDAVKNNSSDDDS